MRAAFSRYAHVGMVTTMVLALAAVPACTQAPEQAGGTGATPAASPAPGPAPRTLWGEPDLSGIWEGGLNARTHNLQVLEGLYRPEVMAEMRKQGEADDPLLRCVPYGIPRAYLSVPWPRQIVQAPGVVVILTEYYHAYRVIPTDGSPHPEGIYPSYFGNSVGRWEGDTLVVDVIAFNGKTWLSDRDKPTPESAGVWWTSDQLHVVERWRRVDAETLEYQAIIDDPKLLTGTWTTPKALFKPSPKGTILGEGMCFDTTTYDLAQEKRDNPAAP